MLSGLRWRLTSLFLLAGLGLVALVSLGAYGLVQYYFQSTTDQALQRKMALGLTVLGYPLSPELVAADQAWAATRPTVDGTSAGPGEQEGEEGREHSEGGQALFFDTDLAPIYLVALDRGGNPVSLPGTSPAAPVAVDGLGSALSAGTDWRTVTTQDGIRVRVLTYRLSDDLALQAGRSVADQDRILAQLMTGLFVIGGLSLLGLGLASWWLAGRSLNPAQQAWARQQTFIANASHELRTPLTLMRASAEFGQRTLPDDTKTARDMFADVITETDHMTQLVTDLLLLSRLDAGQLPLELVPLAVADMMREVGRQMGRLADERGVSVLVQAADEALVRADGARLRQVLLIVLDNALRHTPAGGQITLATEPAGRQLKIVVCDTGSGIPPEHLPRVFERFYRADPARSEQTGGTGLGLAIARSLIEAQHGHIALTSQPGQGTRVELSLPIER